MQIKEINRAFGAVIRKQREALGMSQEELGDTAGLHRTYISLLERGRRSASIETILRLAKALGTSGSDLLCGIDLPNSEVTHKD
jgi:transcriptional regulator with XRE-family HTH domain